MSQEKAVLATVVAKHWTTKAGLDAVIILTRGRHHCGYVGVPVDHVLYGLHYGTNSQYIKDVTGEEPVGQRGPISLLCGTGRETSPEIAYDVHGSLTYSDNLTGFEPEIDPSIWYFGFDCAHCDDGVSEQYLEWCKQVMPGSVCYETAVGFKDVNFCTEQCESLAQQIVDKLIILQLEHKLDEPE